MLLGGAVNGETETQSWSMRQRAAEWEGEHMGGTEDGRWSSISIKGTEFISSVLSLGQIIKYANIFFSCS